MVSDAVRRYERERQHFKNQEYVALFHEHLRRLRGDRPQVLVAAMADVAQAYISRVEAGSTNGIGYYALCRILETYKEFECSSTLQV